MPWERLAGGVDAAEEAIKLRNLNPTQALDNNGEGRKRSERKWIEVSVEESGPAPQPTLSRPTEVRRPKRVVELHAGRGISRYRAGGLKESIGAGDRGRERSSRSSWRRARGGRPGNNRGQMSREVRSRNQHRRVPGPRRRTTRQPLGGSAPTRHMAKAAALPATNRIAAVRASVVGREASETCDRRRTEMRFGWFGNGGLLRRGKHRLEERFGGRLNSGVGLEGGRVMARPVAPVGRSRRATGWEGEQRGERGGASCVQNEYIRRPFDFAPESTLGSRCARASGAGSHRGSL